MEKDPNLLYRVLEEGFEVDSPESIEKWRQSRKANFPTPTNVQKKEEDKGHTVDRGVKFQPKRLSRRIFRYALKEEKNQGGQGGHHNRLPQHSFHNPSSSWVNNRLAPNTSEVVLLHSYYDTVRTDPDGNLVKEKHTVWDCRLMKEVVEEEEQVFPNTATSTHPQSSSISITDDEEDITVFPQATQANTVPERSIQQSNPPPLALAALASYGTDSDLEDGEILDDSSEKLEIQPKANSISSASIRPAGNSNSQIGQLAKNDTSANKDYKGRSDPTNQGVPMSNRNRRKRNRRHKNSQQSAGDEVGGGQIEGQRPQHKKVVPPKRMRRNDREPTLLARLLDDEICEERNTVLCASRFLVQHNFLQGMENSEDATQELLDCIRNSNALE